MAETLAEALAEAMGLAIELALGLELVDADTVICVVGELDGSPEDVGTNAMLFICILEADADADVDVDAESVSVLEICIDTLGELVTKAELELASVAEGTAVLVTSFVLYIVPEEVAVSLLVTELFDEAEIDFVPEDVLELVAELVAVQDGP